MMKSPAYSWPLQCALEGPLAPYIRSFTQSLRNQGFVPESARSKTRLAADFSRWLKRIDAGLSGITDEHIPRYLRYRSRRRCPDQVTDSH